jgi:pimeloyl-ACP methyl ester carboxylesterase
MRFLRSIGGFSGELAEEDLAFVMRVLRHDVTAAGCYFSQHWPRRARTPPLAAPITFIAGTDDPMAPRYQRRHRMCERFGQGVELVTVPGGGHYFHQDQAEVVTRIIEERCRVARSPQRSWPRHNDAVDGSADTVLLVWATRENLDCHSDG